MSEQTEQETAEPTEPGVADVPEPDQEPHEPIPDEADEEAEAAEEAEQTPAAPPPDSEKEMKAVGKKLDAERDRHAKKLGDILGDASTETLPCPLCFDGLMGFVLPLDAGNVPEEQKAAALSFLGESMPSELQPAEGVEMCPRCDGHGQLAYPTRNPHMQTQTCPRCSGNGYVTVQAQPSNVAQITGAMQPTPPAPYGEAAPCPLCGAPNSAGKPHFCNPQANVGAGGV